MAPLKFYSLCAEANYLFGCFVDSIVVQMPWRCLKCGDANCEEKYKRGPVRKRACDYVCYECGESGHIAKDCDKLSTDENLKDWRHIAMIARGCDWKLRPAGASRDGYDANNKTLFLINDDGIKVDIYIGTMTIKTCMNHPVRGKNSLFRPGYYSEGRLEHILKDPRVHTGVGYRSEAGATWICRECPKGKQRRPRSAFSKSQWHKRNKGKIRCADCLS